MHKRGQVTVFVILGLLILIVLALVFYLYGEKLKFQTKEEVKFDFSNVDVVKTYVEDCINKYSLEAINLAGKQGGEVNPGFYQNWNCKSLGDCDKVSYACFTTEYASCYNKKPFFRNFVEQEITNYLKTNLNSCIDLNKLKEAGFNVEAGNLNVNVSILDYNTIVNVNYPITITKGESRLKQDKFTKTFNVPLGKLIKVADDIVNQAINNPQGFIDPRVYVISQNGEIQLERQTHLDTKIYIANVKNDPYKFQFAIQNYVILWP